eukprot:g6151.t1
MGCLWSEEVPAGTENDALRKQRGSNDNRTAFTNRTDANTSAEIRHDDFLNAQGGHPDDTSKEQAVLHDIVLQTRRDFIDVAQKPATVDESALIGRGEKYREQLPNIALSPPALSLTSRNKASSGGIFASLSGATISAKDIDWIKSKADSIKEAVLSTQAQDIGKFVLSFEEL